MNSPEPAVRPASNSSPARRIAVAVILSGLVFAVLWIMVFSMVTSLLIGAGCCVVIVAASSLSDLLDMLLDAVATVIFGVLAVIAAIFGAILQSVRILGPPRRPYDDRRAPSSRVIVRIQLSNSERMCIRVLAAEMRPSFA